MASQTPQYAVSAQNLTYHNGHLSSQYFVAQPLFYPGYPGAPFVPRAPQPLSLEENMAYHNGQMSGSGYIIPHPLPLPQETIVDNNEQASSGSSVTTSPPPPYSRTPGVGAHALQPSLVPSPERISTPVIAPEELPPIQPAPAPAPASGSSSSSMSAASKRLFERRKRRRFIAATVWISHQKLEEFLLTSGID